MRDLTTELAQERELGREVRIGIGEYCFGNLYRGGNGAGASGRSLHVVMLRSPRAHALSQYLECRCAYRGQRCVASIATPCCTLAAPTPRANRFSPSSHTRLLALNLTIALNLTRNRTHNRTLNLTLNRTLDVFSSPGPHPAEYLPCGIPTLQNAHPAVMTVGVELPRTALASRGDRKAFTMTSPRG